MLVTCHHVSQNSNCKSLHPFRRNFSKLELLLFKYYFLMWILYVDSGSRFTNKNCFLLPPSFLSYSYAYQLFYHLKLFRTIFSFLIFYVRELDGFPKIIKLYKWNIHILSGTTLLVFRNIFQFSNHSKKLIWFLTPKISERSSFNFLNLHKESNEMG